MLVDNVLLSIYHCYTKETIISSKQEYPTLIDSPILKIMKNLGKLLC